jgi:Na+/H+-dicarboxylate symporter
MARKKFYQSLCLQVIMGILIGALHGHFYPEAGAAMKPLGGGFIVLGATLSAVGQAPVAGLALILGIDRFMSEARALTNLIGNGVATVVVAKWRQELDEARMRERLARETSAKAEEPETLVA